MTLMLAIALFIAPLPGLAQTTPTPPGNCGGSFESVGASAFAKTFKPMIEERLLIPSAPGLNLVTEAMNYALQAGGKRGRPLLTLAIAYAFSGTSYAVDLGKLMPLAVALEFLHTASLIVDDLPAQDNALLRRGHPTTHTVFPEAIAQLAALSLTQIAMAKISELSSNFDAHLVLELIHDCGSRYLGPGGMMEGQAQDLNHAQAHWNLKDIQRIAHLKTGLAFEASMVSVVKLLGAGDEFKTLFEKLAYHLGQIYQIRDDYLDATKTADQTGKSAVDAINGTQSLVALLGVDAAGKLIFEELKAGLEIIDQLESRGLRMRILRETLLGVATREG